MAEYSRRGFLRNAFTLASGLAVASVIPGVNPLERIALAGDSDDSALMKNITVGASKEEIQKAIDRINYHREQAFRHYVDAGLLDESVIKVKEDPELTDAANKHAAYLVLNRSKISEGDSHSEDKNLLGYTEEGAKIAYSSGISKGNTPSKGIDSFLRMFFHRIYLINPRVTDFGIGFSRSRDEVCSVIGEKIYNTKEYWKIKNTPPMLYPAPEQEMVPLEFAREGEWPDPTPESEMTYGRGVGLPITATFFDRQSIKGVEAVLLETEKFLDIQEYLRKKDLDIKYGSKDWLAFIRYKAIRCWFSSPEKPANITFSERNPSFSTNFDSIALIPHTPLKPDTDYTVYMNATLTDFHKTKITEWNQTWSFKTAPKETKTEPKQAKK